MGLLMDTRLSKLQLTLKQFIMLVHLRNGERPQTDLVLITDCDKGSLTRLIQSLERKGFVQRKAAVMDKRAYIVASTEIGTKALNKAEKIVLKTIEELKKGISQEEEEAAMRVARILTENARSLLDRPKHLI